MQGSSQIQSMIVISVGGRCGAGRGEAELALGGVCVGGTYVQ